MIPLSPPPFVCVIDDDKKDYGPILDALSRLGISWVHVKGCNSRQLRRGSLRGVRVIFTDLHLANNSGKDAASYTANVFKTLLPADTAPTIVVIWSKYADEPVAGMNLPPDDQPTEAELFKQTLLGAVPAFKDRLVFCEMKKPKVLNRPKANAWVSQLKKDIAKEMEKVTGFDVLWTWESFVRETGIKLTERLATLALRMDLPATGNNPSPELTLHDKLRLALRLLVREQGGPDCTTKTAAQHLASALAQTLADQLEHAEGLKSFSKHGAWLADHNDLPKASAVAPAINSLLLTGSLSGKAFPFIPGTVYRVKRENQFKRLFGIAPADLLTSFYGGGVSKFEEWKATSKFKPVLLEISPACDVHQGTRVNSLLLGGLILSSAAQKHVKRSDSIEICPTFTLRWPADSFREEDVFLVFFSRLKVTLAAAKEPIAIIPWFRLRDLPTASLRNWEAGHAARVGYVSLRAL